MNSNNEIQVQNLDHLGLVAGVIDEMGLVEQINQLVGQQPGEIVSPGHVVKAIILNGLGFVSAPLYMFPKFFAGKATEHLIGEGVQPEHLNDDRLGRVMDKLYLKGLSQLFTIVALGAAQRFGVATESVHLDSTSFHVHGKYENNLPQVSVITGGIKPNNHQGEDIEETFVSHPIEITYGYSRDHRPDLKQFILDLICSGDGDVPLFLKVADGNEADKAVFAQVLKDFRQQLTLDTLMVADSALYSAPNLEQMKDLKWLCRVPLTLKQAKELGTQLTSKDFVKSALSGYSVAERTSNYGGIAQPWLVVESEVRRQADIRRLETRLEKSEQEANKKLTKLSRHNFDEIQGAIVAAEQLNQQLKFHNMTDIKVVELPLLSPQKASKKASNITYGIQATLERDQRVIAAETQRAGRFVLATNVLNVNDLSNDEMLCEYKAQQSAERGFGFLKDPLFFTDSVFLKSPERVEALAMLMGLCLLVYTLAQRQLRQALHQAQSGIKNQLGKLTERPTLRWVFQCFQSIHVLIVNGVKQISHLTGERLWILRFFPHACRRYYLLL